MSVSIRLAKIGKKFRPTYKVVASVTRDKRTGRYLDVIGSFNPNVTPFDIKIDMSKFDDWKKKGAIVSEAVQKIIEGTYTFKVYNPKAEKAKKTE
jgi:small subunit ribosomal protein S16